MNILLTANFKNGIFCNGLQQNIATLAELVKSIGFTPIICINHDIEECIDPPTDILIITNSELKDYTDDIQFILNTAWEIPRDIVKYIKKKNKYCKNINILYGNSLLADIERCSWQDHVAVNNEGIDEIWISPHYRFSFNYFKTYYKTDKVLELPYIWSPKYIQMHEKIWNKTGLTCEYVPFKEKSVAILEPNLNITKHCLPSIALIDEFYSNYDASKLKSVTSFCSAKLTDKKYFKSIMWKFQLTKDNKINFAGRMKISKIFAKLCNVVVSHQLLNALNYTYLEALYFNIPLVHNSEFIKDAGYFYPEYDTKLGAEALNSAINNHDANLDQYKKSADKVIERYLPSNAEVLQKYKKLLQ